MDSWSLDDEKKEKEMVMVCVCVGCATVFRSLREDCDGTISYIVKSLELVASDRLDSPDRWPPPTAVRTTRHDTLTHTLTHSHTLTSDSAHPAQPMI